MMHRIGAVMYLIWGVLHVNAALKVCNTIARCEYRTPFGLPTVPDV